ncbi:MEDS domain-containing protein [Candidatus Daviesbacteria bacterium]|nr:MEDS domain-containing protein [Candidatus Daviesbacteria bacterium]
MIKKEFRDSGIDIVGKVPWGTHFCQFYRTQKDLSDVLVRYFKAGLENNEFCVWVTSEFLTREDALKSLKKVIPRIEQYLKKGQMEIFPYTDWYLKQGKFEMKRVLKMWVNKHNEGLKKGFAGLRVSGNPFWIDNKKDWDDFASYEAEINRVIGPYKLLVLCTYSLEKCSADEVIDVVTNHQFALIRRRGKLELIKSAEQKKAEEEIAHLASFPELNINPIVEINIPGEVMYANPASKKLFPGIKEEGIKHTALLGINPGSTKKSGPLIREIPLGDKWYRQAIIYVPEADSVRIYNNDITDRKKLEQLKDEFLGVASHELKTPVTSIKAYTQILRKIFYDKGDIRSAEMLGKMEAQVNRIIGLIADLLDITKIQTGKMQFNYKYFDFNEMIDEVSEDVQRISPQHEIIKELARTKTIYGDRERLGQVITNFLTNAIKYSPKNDRVILKTVVDDKKVTLSVRDFGMGIPEEKRQKVFERFYRVETTGERTPTGLGLGLYISSEIIKRHQGKIGVKSNTGKGSTFYFVVPLKPVQK